MEIKTTTETEPDVYADTSAESEEGDIPEPSGR